ncbi:conserved hypothetical protein [Histoplasma capsulatum G186AR]|uniref:Uncharacterized protein n=2 Tax=Ajellomyces capsulatus TaxID=5037 RepID=C0NXT2_AJECG|nr:uncharacterized protein HCBG_07726 [Histoplasma capsulatum G186AR]EEH03600.1 conserved hypothetical protein [Histoplasma capsulatum G186AR]KAG5293827.1 hypothetical protein I7I52_05277 [Histoplasma capsulatum]QSS75279.1 hypothetical protein I7I50_04369 [Histoplasma capsulatum G186AR]
MSGSNPFRHKKKPNDQTAPQLHEPHQPSLSSAHNTHSDHRATTYPASGTHGEGPSRPSQRQKTVRIASPPVPTQPPLHPSAGDHSSPASYRSPFPHRGTHLGSPPPPSRGESSESDEESEGDPFNPDASGSDNGEYKDNGDGRRVTEGKPGVIGLGFECAQRGSKESYRAEPPAQPDGHDPGTSLGIEDSMTPSHLATKGKRATMDVDTFTRMLLTGETGEVGKESGPAAQKLLQPNQGPPISDSSSNTDTGSTSKQPIFETRHLPRIDTPRTSHELSTSEADDERLKLSNLPSPAERQKPLPPKTRRGKLINPNTGQTSPLAGLTSITSPNHRSASPASLSSRSFTEQESGDLNKPLPKPPIDNSSLPVSPKQTHEDSENRPPLPQQRRPPTPPLTRRHSQLNPSKSILSRSKSARHSMPPTHTTNNSSSSTHISSPLKAPPTPPSRRKDRDSSTFSSSETLPLFPQERRPTSSHQRSDSRGDSDKRSPHIAETISTTSNNRDSQGPPRPPPPRRGGGSRASLDETRTPVLLGTADSPTTRMEKGTQDSKLESPGTPLQSHAVDILADLSRLQKEVDDLRGRYEGRKPSA